MAAETRETGMATSVKVGLCGALGKEEALNGA
jgi:hypothetical protein